jgi:hypothetical protein
MRGVSCPVALVCAAEGFFPDSDPLISGEARAAMEDALDVRDHVFLEKANHYTMMWEPHTGRWADILLADWTRG